MPNESYYESFLKCIREALKNTHAFKDQQIDDIMVIVEEACKQHGVDWKLA